MKVVDNDEEKLLNKETNTKWVRRREQEQPKRRELLPQLQRDEGSGKAAAEHFLPTPKTNCLQ